MLYISTYMYIELTNKKRITTIFSIGITTAQLFAIDFFFVFINRVCVMYRLPYLHSIISVQTNFDYRQKKKINITLHIQKTKPVATTASAAAKL